LGKRYGILRENFRAGCFKYDSGYETGRVEDGVRSERMDNGGVMMTAMTNDLTLVSAGNERR
jgi:hypothetical protein